MSPFKLELASHRGEERERERQTDRDRDRELSNLMVMGETGTIKLAHLKMKSANQVQIPAEVVYVHFSTKSWEMVKIHLSKEDRSSEELLSISGVM